MENYENLYPVDDELQKFIDYRKRTGSIWRGVFLMSLFVAILVLIVLMLNIINDAFGLVAVENEIDPHSLVIDYQENTMVNMPNTLVSADHGDLANGIIDNDSAIGFIGHAHYQANADELRLIAVDGQFPTAETVADGSYPFVRPLYIYTALDTLQSEPAVAEYFRFYLENANLVVGEMGYFPADETLVADQISLINKLAGSPQTADSVTGDLALSGSSSLYPLSRQMLVDFRQAGFNGDIGIEQIGSTAGIEAFCAGDIQVLNASRPMTAAEASACQRNRINPVEIAVGLDALAVVSNPSLDFLESVSWNELSLIFTAMNFWDEIDPSYPALPIVRSVPSAGSGSLNFLSARIFSDIALENLPTAAYADIIRDKLGRGRGRALERDQRFLADGFIFDSESAFTTACASDEPPTGCSLGARDRDNLFDVIEQEIIVPQVQETWPLYDSLFKQQEIVNRASAKYPDAIVEFKSWLNRDFLFNPQSSEAELAGVRTAIWGTVMVVATTFLFSFPVGVGAAIYMEEYADQTLWYNKIIQTNISNLAGVPSIIYGMLGLTVFVRLLLPLTSGQFFGRVAEGTDPSGRTVISAGLTLGLLILPIIIINAQEALRAVPNSMRRAGMGLGATKWQTTWSHVLPQALPGILTGTILAMSRAVGETAPLIVVGASTVIRTDPTFFSRFTVLPIQIFQWTSRPQAEFQNLAAAAIIVLLIILLTLNASAVILRNRYSTSN